MLPIAFFLAISVSLANCQVDQPPILTPKYLIRLADPPVEPPFIQPKQIVVDSAPPVIQPKQIVVDAEPPVIQPKQITPRQSSSCSNVQFAFTSPGQTGELTSLNYPYDYPENLDCSYFISSPEGTTMTISCDTFNVACNNDYLSISTSGDSDLSNAPGYCGQGQIPEQSTDSNQITIGFHSDYYKPYSSDWYRFRCTIQVSDTAAPGPAPAPVPTSAPGPAPAPVPTSAPGSCSCGVRNQNGATRIVGGEQTKTGELPWRVAVFIADSSGRGYLCGGTIISPNWVMTAAHCTSGATPASNTISVFTGAQANPVSVGSGTQYNVDRWTQHPGYNSQTMDNDITLLHISKPIVMANNVSPVCLPWNLVNKDFSGTSVLASGWGTTKPVPINTKNTDPSSSTLMKVVLPVLTTTECREYMPDLTDNMICTYKPGYDTCQGDSGGSIDYQSTNSFYYAIGVVSYGYGCAQTNAPGVYTKVINYLPWIQTTAAGENFCKV